MGRYNSPLLIRISSSKFILCTLSVLYQVLSFRIFYIRLVLYFLFIPLLYVMSISLHCHLYITQGHPHQGQHFSIHTHFYPFSHILYLESPKHRLFQKRLNLGSDTTKVVTPLIPVRPDWRIRTGFGVRNHILGLFFFFFLKAELISVVYK